MVGDKLGEKYRETIGRESGQESGRESWREDWRESGREFGRDSQTKPLPCKYKHSTIYLTGPHVDNSFLAVEPLPQEQQLKAPPFLWLTLL